MAKCASTLVLLALPVCVLGASMPKSPSSTASTPQQTYPMGYKANMNIPIKRSYVRTGPQELAKTYQKHTSAVPEHIADAALVASSQPSTSVQNNPQAYDSLYLSSVQIGGQTFNLDFDTGSADLWVFSNLMPNSESNGHDVYQTSASKQAKGLNWTIEYGDGTNAAGLVYLDTVSINGGTVQNQAVEAASNAAHNFVQNDGLDGLMGLGFSTLNQVSPQRQATWFENIKDSLPAPLFAVDLRHQQPGSYDFGFIDNSKYTGAVTYVNVDPSAGYWLFGVQGYIIESGTSSSKAKRSVVSRMKSNLYNFVSRAGFSKYPPKPRPFPATSSASLTSTVSANHTSSSVKTTAHSSTSSIKATGINIPKPVHSTPKPSIRYTTTTTTTTERKTIDAEATHNVFAESAAKQYAPQPYKIPPSSMKTSVKVTSTAQGIPHPVAPTSTSRFAAEEPVPHTSSKKTTTTAPRPTPHGPSSSVRPSTNVVDIPKSTVSVKTSSKPQAIPKPSQPVRVTTTSTTATTSTVPHVGASAPPSPSSSSSSSSSSVSSSSSSSSLSTSTSSTSTSSTSIIPSPTSATPGGTFVSSPFSAIADTGTSLLLLPSNIVSAYWSTVPSGYYSNYYAAWLFSCSAASSLPNFAVRIGGHDAVVPGKYINYGPLGYASDGTEICYGGIQDGGSFEYAILGDVFLKSVYAVFVDETEPVSKGGDPGSRSGNAMFGIAEKSVPL